MARINASETPKSIIVVEIIDELLGIIEQLEEDVALLKRPLVAIAKKEGIQS